VWLLGPELEALEIVLDHPVAYRPFFVPMKDKFKLQGHLIEYMQ
jgi:hypothetical protein